MYIKIDDDEIEVLVPLLRNIASSLHDYAFVSAKNLADSNIAEKSACILDNFISRFPSSEEV